MDVDLLGSAAGSRQPPQQQQQQLALMSERLDGQMAKARRADHADEIIGAINALGQSLGGRLDKMAEDVHNITKQQKELEGELRTQSVDTRRRFEELEGRLAKIEEKQETAAAAAAAAAPEQQQQQQRRRNEKESEDMLMAVLGGWAKDSKKAVIEKEFKEHFQSHLHMVEWFVPKKRTSVVLLRYENLAQKRADAQFVRDRAERLLPGRSAWHIPSRPPEIREQRAVISRVLRVVATHLSEDEQKELDWDHGAGIIYYDDVRILQRQSGIYNILEDKVRAKVCWA